jgi:hypothetical protein
MAEDREKDLYYLDPLTIAGSDRDDYLFFYVQESTTDGYKLPLSELKKYLSSSLPVVRTFNGLAGDLIISPDSLSAAKTAHNHSIDSLDGLSDTLGIIGSDLAQLSAADDTIATELGSIDARLDTLDATLQGAIATLGSKADRGYADSLESSISALNSSTTTNRNRLDTLSAAQPEWTSQHLGSDGVLLAVNQSIWIEGADADAGAISLPGDRAGHNEIFAFADDTIAVVSGSANDSIAYRDGTIREDLLQVNLNPGDRSIAQYSNAGSQWQMMIF